MSKYILTIAQKNIQNDGLSKPKKDINQILEKHGYQSIQLTRLVGKISKLKCSSVEVDKLVKKMSNGDLMIVHYPTYMGTLFDMLLLRRAHKKNIKTVAFIHDIDSLRFKMAMGRGLRYEINVLNKYSFLIVPNTTMLDFLIRHGLKTPSVTLTLFDYLTMNEGKNEAKSKYSHTIYFAGNLNKAGFISKLKNTETIAYHFYGPLKDQSALEKKMYFGSLSSDDLLKKIDGGFGLIWDGPDETISDANGVSFGNYLRYNNPYKLSFYIAAGIPVIIWKDAAEAKFVVENSLGFIIDNLSEIPDIIGQVSEEEYTELSENVGLIRDEVLRGSFTLDALDKINRLIE